MALTLKGMGIEAYCDEKLPGGFARFEKIAVGKNAWPKGAVAKELGISRPWLDTLIAKYEEEKKT